jgi:hypothetical protein
MIYSETPILQRTPFVFPFLRTDQYRLYALLQLVRRIIFGLRALHTLCQTYVSPVR